ncbi:PadR family transcriptional regulator [Paenibacillus tritici]|uniref:PadR family transcriptional regulator n=1 Tax=Paenibacillus tritici TaxID=1873425 RepID=UPI001FE4B19A|nr:PadR family transcriptional regulator [Paenibacillus tritici]
MSMHNELAKQVIVVSATDKVLKKYVPMTETAFYILLSLTKPRHGYGIIKHVEELSAGRLRLGSGTVYGTLTKMNKDGLIFVFADEERKTVYEVSSLGKEVMRAEISRLKELHRNAITSEEEFV